MAARKANTQRSADRHTARFWRRLFSSHDRQVYAANFPSLFFHPRPRPRPRCCCCVANHFCNHARCARPGQSPSLLFLVISVSARYSRLPSRSWCGESSAAMSICHASALLHAVRRRLPSCHLAQRFLSSIPAFPCAASMAPLRLKAASLPIHFKPRGYSTLSSLHKRQVSSPTVLPRVATFPTRSISTQKRRRTKMNKHKLRKRRKALHMNTKVSRF